MSGRKVLIVDGKPLRRELHAFGLRCAGYNVDEAESAEAAYTRIARSCLHLVLVSSEQLDEPVRELVQTLRANPLTAALPIMLLIEHAGQNELDAALEWGIDDLLRLPVLPESLVGRARALTRVNERALCANSFAELQIDDERGALRRGNRSVSVAPTERRLFQLFLQHAGEVLPRELLLFRVWGGASRADTRLVDVSVCRLRRILEQLGYDGLMQTVRGKGYRLATTITQGASPPSAVSKLPSHAGTVLASRERESGR
jgi:DNA-binding response OmpR family regulator